MTINPEARLKKIARASGYDISKSRKAESSENFGGYMLIHAATNTVVAAFVERDRPWATVSVEFVRVALTSAQVLVWELPTSPAKATDSRSKSWEGGTCQLEALPPDVIARILQEAILKYIDLNRLEEAQGQEAIDIRKIAGALPAPRGDA